MACVVFDHEFWVASIRTDASYTECRMAGLFRLFWGHTEQGMRTGMWKVELESWASGTICSQIPPSSNSERSQEEEAEKEKVYKRHRFIGTNLSFRFLSLFDRRLRSTIFAPESFPALSQLWFGCSFFFARFFSASSLQPCAPFPPFLPPFPWRRNSSPLSRLVWPPKNDTTAPKKPNWPRGNGNADNWWTTFAHWSRRSNPPIPDRKWRRKRSPVTWMWFWPLPGTLCNWRTKFAACPTPNVSWSNF